MSRRLLPSNVVGIAIDWMSVPPMEQLRGENRVRHAFCVSRERFGAIVDSLRRHEVPHEHAHVPRAARPSATDSSSGTGPFIATHDYTLTVNPPPIVLIPGPLPNAQAGSAYIQTLSASGGTGPPWPPAAAVEWSFGSSSSAADTFA